MCGIAGILAGAGAAAPSVDSLLSMVAALSHRGPDAYGVFRDAGVALGHARLSIVDLAGGAQPMCNEDGTIWTTFNGEIFNYMELRAELEAKGHTFRTRCDTEVIVHAYEQWGARAWARFNGQFAFAIWDSPRGELVLVRDQFGIPPLFYARSRSGIVFASELKSIFASGLVDVTFDAGGLVQAFTRWSAVAPATTFSGVNSVPPGHSITINRQLEVRTERWWQPDFSARAQSPASLEAAVDGLEERLQRAVDLRLRADVPVGAYLSGGLDSSLITSLIQRSDSSPLQTFSIRFEDEAFDETPQQRLMAKRLATTHHEVYVRDEDIAANLVSVVRHCETPLLRTSPVPLFMLSERVRDAGMKVVLTGEGADELFAGYSIFKEDKIRRFWARSPSANWRSALLARVHPEVAGMNEHDGRMWRDFFRRGLTDVDDPFYAHRIRWANTSWATRFLKREMVEDVDRKLLETDLRDQLPAGWQSWPALGRAQLVEIATFMSPYLLASQGDRVSLAHGVEVRYPFLDPEVIDYASGLPDKFKLSAMRDKRVLRALGLRHLPASICERPKQPYRAPISSALFGPRAPDYVRELLAPEALQRHGLLEAGPARLLVEKALARSGQITSEREEMALVGILTLQILAHWLRVEHRGEVAERLRQLRQTKPSVIEDRVAGEPALAHGSMG